MADLTTRRTISSETVPCRKQRNGPGKRYYLLFHVRTSSYAVLRKSSYRIYPKWQSYRLKQAGRTVDVYARRPQIQERLTVQIADALERVLAPKGIMVMLEAEHTCMTMRGIKKPGSKTVTTVTRGEFKENMELQKQFLAMVKD